MICFIVLVHVGEYFEWLVLRFVVVSSSSSGRVLVMWFGQGSWLDNCFLHWGTDWLLLMRQRLSFYGRDNIVWLLLLLWLRLRFAGIYCWRRFSGGRLNHRGFVFLGSRFFFWGSRGGRNWVLRMRRDWMNYFYLILKLVLTENINVFLTSSRI